MHECEDGMEVDGTSCEPANMNDNYDIDCGESESECADQHAVVAESVRGEGSSSSGPRPYSFAPVKACSGKYMALSTPTLSQGVLFALAEEEEDEGDDSDSSSSSSSSTTTSFNTSVNLMDGPINMPGCLCGRCLCMEKECENVCCLQENFDGVIFRNGFVPGPDSCVCTSVEIQRILDPIMLGLAWQRQQMLKGLKDQLSFRVIKNREYRHHAYVCYVQLVHGLIGKRHRKVIPSCVVNYIRQLWPDPNGRYVGFRAPEQVEAIQSIE
jgi:hypothetical protein